MEPCDITPPECRDLSAWFDVGVADGQSGRNLLPLWAEKNVQRAYETGYRSGLATKPDYDWWC